MARSRLFGRSVAPACAYCAIGRPSLDNLTVACERMGFTQPSYHCNKFVYDPLKRVPRRAPLIRKYDEGDFRL